MERSAGIHVFDPQGRPCVVESQAAGADAIADELRAALRFAGNLT